MLSLVFLAKGLIRKSFVLTKTLTDMTLPSSSSLWRQCRCLDSSTMFPCV
nr:MAG TPA: hypothetical protein [Caudoviricetes sp.]